MSDPYKTIIRNTLKQIRSALSVAFRATASQAICARIKKLEHYRQAKRIALYHAIRGEVNLDALWRSAPLQGKYCYFPALKDDLTLVFLPATPTTAFKKNQYGILEPDVEHHLSIDLNDLDILIVPLLGFDAQCNRLGMGAGYYDRTFAQKPKGLLLGVAYEFQRLDFIETESWDVPLDGVITPKNHYWRPG